MPHPEREHELMIEVARLRKEADDAHTRERSLRTDLAAARRECEELRTALEKAADGLRHGEAADLSPTTAELPIVSWRAIRDAYHAARKALAAPGAAPEKPYPEPRCTCHARYDGKHAQACELWNTTGDL